MADTKQKPAMPSPPEPQKRPEGWWSISAHGMVSGVLKAVNEQSDIPDYAKSFLRASVADKCGQNNFVRLDAHFHVADGKDNGDIKGKSHLSVTINPSTVLT